MNLGALQDGDEFMVQSYRKRDSKLYTFLVGVSIYHRFSSAASPMKFIVGGTFLQGVKQILGIWSRW